MLLRKKGFTLVELLVGTFVSLLLLSVVLRVYLMQKNAYQLQMELARRHENATTALHVLTQAIQGAGYMGCRRLNGQLPLLAIHGVSANGQKRGDSFVATQADFANTSLLLKQKNKKQIWLSRQYPVKPLQWYIISDCLHAERVQVVTSQILQQKQLITLKRRTKYRYKRLAMFSALQQRRYFVSSTGYKNRFGDTIYGLFLQEAGQADVLVDGVEDMTIQYGVVSKQGLRYLAANQISNWQAVTKVRIRLLMTTTQGTAKPQASVEFAGRQYKPSDHLLHQTWQKDIVLRERV